MTTLALQRTALPLPAFPRMPRGLLRQLVRYGVVGGLGTLVSALLYLVFRDWWDAVPANLAALALSTVASTELNRRVTFRGAPVDRAREYLQNAGTVVFYAFYGSAVLVLLGDLVDSPTAVQESLAVAVASVLGGAVRFLVLRNWVFAPDRARTPRLRHSGRMARLTGGARRVLLASAALGGLLLSTAGACDTASAPSVPPATAPAATVAPTGDDSGDDRGRGGDDSRDDSRGDDGESEGPDDGGLSGRGNEGESR